MKRSSYNYRINLLIVLGIALLISVYYLGYSTGMSAPPAGTATISLQDAQRYSQNYQKNDPYVMNGVINALVIDMQQYNAMTQVMQNTVGTNGFRVYFGRDDSNQPLCIIAGIGANGHDITTYLLSTGLINSGICPPVCDSPSGIPGE